LVAGISFGILLLNIIFQLFFLSNNQAKEKLQKKIISFLYTCTISYLMLTFFRWQDLPLLNYQIVWYLLTIFLFIWLINIFIYFLINYKKDIKKIKQEINFQKYLGKK